MLKVFDQRDVHNRCRDRPEMIGLVHSDIGVGGISHYCKDTVLDLA
jgi:hypothetical protein